MNKKILTIAITCSFCFLLISNLAVADKPEKAEVRIPERIRKPERAVGVAESEKDEELRKDEREAEKQKNKKRNKGSSDDDSSGHKSSDDDSSDHKKK